MPMSAFLFKSNIKLNECLLFINKTESMVRFMTSYAMTILKDNSLNLEPAFHPY